MPPKAPTTNELPLEYLPDPKLDLTVLHKGSKFQIWKQKWESFAVIAELQTREATKQVAALTLALTDDTLIIMNHLALKNEDDKKNVTKLIEGLEAYAKGVVNEVVESYNFNVRSQLEGETFDEFYTELQELQKTCNYQVGTEKRLLRLTIQHHNHKRWTLRGKIVGVLPKRSYRVKLQNGNILVRNRRQLRAIPSPLYENGSVNFSGNANDAYSTEEESEDTDSDVSVEREHLATTKGGRKVYEPDRFSPSDYD